MKTTQEINIFNKNEYVYLMEFLEGNYLQIKNRNQ